MSDLSVRATPWQSEVRATGKVLGLEHAATTRHTLIPDPEHFLRLEPEELAGPILMWLGSLSVREFSHSLFNEESVLVGIALFPS
jgi:hypothetical protein